MQTIPVDVNRLGSFMVVVPPEPRVTPEGEQRKDREGRPLFVVGLVVRQADGRRADVIEVAVPEEPAGLTVGTRVTCVDLDAISWSIGDRSGIAWRAVAIRATDQPALGKGKPGSGAAPGGER